LTALLLALGRADAQAPPIQRVAETIWQAGQESLDAPAHCPANLDGIDRPPSGVSVDRLFCLTASRVIARPCVAVVYQPSGLRVLLDANRLEDMVRNQPASRGEELLPMSYLNGVRAQTLLQQRATASRSPEGCRQLPDAALGEAGYLLLRELEAGQARVVGRDGRPMPKVLVRYVGHLVEGATGGRGSGSGHIVVALPGQRPFMALMWWIT